MPVRVEKHCKHLRQVSFRVLDDNAGLSPTALYANHHGYCARNSNGTLTCWGLAIGSYTSTSGIFNFFSKATNIGSCVDFVSDNAASYACYNGASWSISPSFAASPSLYTSLFAGATGSNVMRGLYGMGYFNANSLTIWFDSLCNLFCNLAKGIRSNFGCWLSLQFEHVDDAHSNRKHRIGVVRYHVLLRCNRHYCCAVLHCSCCRFFRISCDPLTDQRRPIEQRNDYRCGAWPCFDRWHPRWWISHRHMEQHTLHVVG